MDERVSRGVGRQRGIEGKSHEEIWRKPGGEKDFGWEPKIAGDTYKILKQVVNSDGDIEDSVFKSIMDKIRQESGITAEIPVDRLVDLSLLREVRKAIAMQKRDSEK